MTKKNDDVEVSLTAEATESGNDKATERLRLLKSRLKVAKAFSKKPHEAWKRWIGEYEIEDPSDTSEIRDKVRIGYVFRKIESEVPAIFDDQPEIFIKGRNSKIKALEPQFQGGYDYLWDVQNLEEKIEDCGTYFDLLGMGFLKSPWVTKTKKVVEPALNPDGSPALNPDGTPVMREYDVPVIDNPMAEALDPFKVHFSPETKFGPVLDYDHCPYLFDESAVMTTEAIEARFHKKVEASETLKIDDDELDKDSELLKDDLKRATVYEYHGCLPRDLAPEVSAWTFDKSYRIFFTNNEELEITDDPDESKPYFIVGNYGLANKFWKFGDTKHLIPLVREYEQYRSKLLKHTRKMSSPKPLIPLASNVDEQAFSDPNGDKAVKYNGQVPPSYLQPAPLGGEVEIGINLVKTDIEKQSGTFDLENGNGQSTVKTPRGIQVYSEASDRNIRRKRKKIARFIRQIMIFQFQQLADNWNPTEEKKITVDGEDQIITADILSVFGDPQILSKLDIELESLEVNRVQMRQDGHDLMDLAAANPDIFKREEIAKWLLQNGFNMRDGDRFLYTPQERAEMAKKQPEPPKVSVSVKADATTPPGAAILENEGVLQPGQGVEAVVNNATVEQAKQLSQANNQPVNSANETSQPQLG